MTDRLQIGLIGAGPWATAVHAPAIATHPDTELAGVWARRPDAAAALASMHGAQAFDSVSSLIAAVDTVAFAVPPAVQAPFAIEAATAGRHLLLEKPIAATVEDAVRLADAVATAGVASIVMLVMRFAPEIRRWLDDVRSVGGWRAGTGRWLSGGLIGGPYAASPWRHDDGALADVGPHTVDLIDAAIGPVTRVLAARHAEPDMWHVILEHDTPDGVATSTVTLSARVAVNPTICSVELYGANGHSATPARTSPALDSYATLLDELVAMVRGGITSHECDVHRGLHLQRILGEARILTQA